MNYNQKMEQLITEMTVPKPFQKKIAQYENSIQSVFSRHDLNQITLKLLEESKNDRKRQHQILRSSNDLNAVPAIMINALQPGTYVRPHKHESTQSQAYETYIALSGELTAIHLNDKGVIADFKTITPKNPFFFTQPNKYHTLISRKEDSIIAELYWGVYTVQEYKEFLETTPKEEYNEKELNPKAKNYLEYLLNETS